MLDACARARRLVALRFEFGDVFSEVSLHARALLAELVQRARRRVGAFARLEKTVALHFERTHARVLPIGHLLRSGELALELAHARRERVVRVAQDAPRGLRIVEALALFGELGLLLFTRRGLGAQLLAQFL